MKVSFPSVARNAVYEVLNTKHRSLSVLDVLSGSKQIRFGKRMSDAHVLEADNLIRRYEQVKAPIQMVTCWGAVKCYGLFDLHSIDFSDFVGIHRFKELNDAVKVLYEPGIKITILIEDVTEELLGGCCRGIQYYGVQLEMLVRSLGLDGVVDIVFESNFIEAHHDLNLYTNVIKKFAKTFYEGNYPHGWSGEIVKERWDYYIQRARTEKPELSDEQARWHVSLYFAASLARYQVGAYYSPTDGVDGLHIPAFKCSFSPYPAGTPESLYKNRFEYKVKASKNSNKSVPPWAGFAVFNNDDWSMVGVRELRELKYEVTSIDIGGTHVAIVSV